MARVQGTGGKDFIHRADDGRTPPAGVFDIPRTTEGDDRIDAGLGDDTILAGLGDDTAFINAATDGADSIDLGKGSDRVEVDGQGQVRLTFTSSEVGNGSGEDSGVLANQDGGLAVRLQAEDSSDGLQGPVSRVDDEGITFFAGDGVTFDVRDLVSGAARGDQFEIVKLGSVGAESIDPAGGRSAYINAGLGNDQVKGGRGDDFLVGGGGDDTLLGGRGDDSFIGGAGDDSIFGGDGFDVATVNVNTDGADQIDLGNQSDVLNVNATTPGQVRLTFTSSEVGSEFGRDSNTMANQDGGLAVRMQAEDGSDGLTGPVSRVDDEGITFVAGAGVTFDVRDLVSGAARGDQFEVVTLGTFADDELGAVQDERPYYINGGQGDDVITDGRADDFLVGGAGNDTLTATRGQDSFIGGGGDDLIFGGRAGDVAIQNITTDGADQIDLGRGDDTVNVNATTPTEVRLTFTSAEVGNNADRDAGTGTNQDGGLAVRMQAEDGLDGLTGPITRTDDEGITFEAGTGVTFDVRDLVAGIQRGNEFSTVQLGTQEGENLRADDDDAYYINAGGGDDTLSGRSGDDFLVGGVGDDRLNAQDGTDSMIGGAGADTFAFSSPLGADNVDAILDFSVGDDTIQLQNSVFIGLAAGDLDPEAFRPDSTVATETDDRIIYDGTSGALFFDQDGAGSDFDAIQFATITAGLTLDDNDFKVV